MKSNKIKSQKGQTILEMVIAAGIIVSSVVTVIALGIVTIRGGRESEYRVVAANLAREGIEYFRNKRDTNWLNGISSWYSGFPGAPTNGSYKLAFTETGWSTPIECTDFYTCPTDGQSSLLKLNNGIYNYTSGTATPFYRLITFNYNNLPDNITIKSEVLWKLKSKDYKVTLEENLTQWR